ncbi:MAG: hypothetical protein JXR39_13275 [Marinilabiliaceae bacterium]|nr:hypothetical protein [Marinilabiliaceae bacterium]
MKTKYLIAFMFSAMMFMAGCSGDDATPPPGAVVLVSPAGSEVCVKGKTTSGTTTSLVAFSWKAAEGAENYRVDVTNLNTQAKVSQTVKGVTFSTALDVNAYYSWQITALNGGGESSSDAFGFYLSGTPDSNYAPFPAELTFPAMDAVLSAGSESALSVSFQWMGTDLDNDVAGYLFYIDQADASTQVGSLLTSGSVTHALERGKTYFWKVVTTDKAGNNSTSAVASFTIQ